MSDILLTDENVIVVGSSEVTSTGSGAGFAFTDRDPKVEGRWVWYANGGKAHLYADGHSDLVTVQSNGGVEANSFTSSGSNAGFIFSDRNPLAGGWCWYAQNGKARLSVDPRGDVLDVDATNGLHVRSLDVDGAVVANSFDAKSFRVGVRISLTESGLSVSDGIGPNRHSVRITASSLMVDSPKPSATATSPARLAGPVLGPPGPSLPTETLDLIAEVKALRQEVNALKAKVGL